MKQMSVKEALGDVANASYTQIGVSRGHHRREKGCSLPQSLSEGQACIVEPLISM